jgi:hypothetical protein
MSLQCPLCGKEKAEDELFCGDCSRKIKNEYEVGVSASLRDDAATEPPLPEISGNGLDVEPAGLPLAPAEKKKTGRKWKSAFLAILAFALVAVSGFYGYKYIVLASNLERGDWDVARKENTVEAYLAYAQKYPEGKHTEEALENLMALKDSEALVWEQVRVSDNTAELQNFMRQYPQSAYLPLVKTRMDSLMWVAAVNTNTAQAYSDYIAMSGNGAFNGDYIVRAKQRSDMLRQDSPVDSDELDSLKLIVDGFYIALSNVDYNRLNEYLAPVVERFFASGVASRESVVSSLLMAGAKTPTPTIKFTPDINALTYEKNAGAAFSCNVPLLKCFVDMLGVEKNVPGYIAHIEMDSAFAITQIYEDKPYPSAP